MGECISCCRPETRTKLHRKDKNKMKKPFMKREKKRINVSKMYTNECVDYEELMLTDRNNKKYILLVKSHYLNEE